MRLLIFTAALLAGSATAQMCSSQAAAGYGGWKTVSSAPRDGTVVEMVQTYGIAPWYGIFKWTKEYSVTDKQGKTVKISVKDATWVSIDKPGTSVSETCLYWRPYKVTGKYVDPTNGAQNSVSYWCAYAHRPYDAKLDTCK